MKKTVILGASDNPQRYSFLAIQRLRKFGHPVIAIGRKTARVSDVDIYTNTPNEAGVNTVSLYLNPLAQKDYYSYILSLHPQRIIFNPGTENEELAEMAKANGIQVLEACTLVMLNTAQY
jgi:uncharacterized protein